MQYEEKKKKEKKISSMFQFMNSKNTEILIKLFIITIKESKGNKY
jgi:hypothetical protein